jgi:rRNA-processing protein FCF1
LAKIACDTDFLIKIANDPLPRFDWSTLSAQNDFCTLPCVYRELANLKSSRIRATAKRATMALSVVGQDKSSKIRILSVEGKREPSWARKEASADEALIEFVGEEPKGRMVATLDGKLLSRLEKNRLPYLTLSSGRPLIVSRGAMHLTRNRA